MSTPPDDITVLDGAVRLRQVPDGFKTSMDSVLLAAASPAHIRLMGKENDIHRVLDLGCGVGSAGLCVLHRAPNTTLTGIDILPDHVALAHENAVINGMASRAEFIAEDIRDFEDGQFDHVICNPPYLENGSYIPSPKAHKEIAIGHGEDDIDLQDWIDAAHRNLKSGGSFTIIHRADMVDRIIRGFGKRFGAIEIIPLWPKLSVAAKRVIVRGIKDRKSPATIHAGIVLHNSDGEYSARAQQILRKGQSL